MPLMRPRMADVISCAQTGADRPSPTNTDVTSSFFFIVSFEKYISVPLQKFGYRATIRRLHDKQVNKLWHLCDAFDTTGSPCDCTGRPAVCAGSLDYCPRSLPPGMDAIILAM